MHYLATLDWRIEDGEGRPISMDMTGGEYQKFFVGGFHRAQFFHLCAGHASLEQISAATAVAWAKEHCPLLLSEPASQEAFILQGLLSVPCNRLEWAGAEFFTLVKGDEVLLLGCPNAPLSQADVPAISRDLRLLSNPAWWLLQVRK